VLYQQGKGKQMVTIKLTDTQLGNLLWAIYLTEASFDGYTDEEMGEAKQWLRSLRQVEGKLQEARNN
jgi:hypothetical protein